MDRRWFVAGIANVVAYAPERSGSVVVSVPHDADRAERRASTRGGGERSQVLRKSILSTGVNHLHRRPSVETVLHERIEQIDLVPAFDQQKPVRSNPRTVSSARRIRGHHRTSRLRFRAPSSDSPLNVVASTFAPFLRSRRACVWTVPSGASSNAVIAASMHSALWVVATSLHIPFVHPATCEGPDVAQHGMMHAVFHLIDEQHAVSGRKENSATVETVGRLLLPRSLKRQLHSIGSQRRQGTTSPSRRSGSPPPRPSEASD